MISKPFRGTGLTANHPLRDSLIAAWILNEGNGTKINEGLRISPGDIQGTPEWKDGSIEFTGADTTDYIDCGNNPLLDLVDGFTVMVRAKWTSDNNKVMVCKDAGFPGWGFTITAGDPGDLRFTRYGIADITATSANLPANTWTTVSITKEGSNYHFYANGVFIETVVQAGDVASAGQINIGRRVAGGGGAEWFDGSIDFVYVWNRILDAEEHRRIYADPYQMFQQLDYGFLTTAAGGALLRIINEAIQSSEDRQRNLTMSRIKNESESIGETIIKTGFLNRVITETQQIIESVLRSRALTRIKNEAVNITEQLLRNFNLTRIKNEVVNITEQLLRNRILVRVKTETINLIEQVIKNFTLTKIINEIQNITESILKIRGLVKIKNEVLSISENALNILKEFISSPLKSILNIFNYDDKRHNFTIDTDTREFEFDNERRIFYVK